MIKVLVIDDEPLARLVVLEYLRNYTEIELLAECGDGFEGSKAILQHKPDLIFLDVQMPKINGFEMLELIDEPPAVIFTTAFDEFAIKAFEASAIDYLLKPFTRERFDRAMAQFLSRYNSQGKPAAENNPASQLPQLPGQEERIVVKTGTKIRIIPVQDIWYLKADDDYVSIYTAEGRFLKSKTMQHFEQTLPAREFVRVHRSYLVHVNQVSRIEPYEKDSHIAVLSCGDRVPVSRSGYAKLKEVLGL
ncbi:MAG: LytTR family transcriptional regulator DNA-binding domain-containing protein [Mucilaginibacter polytrichastri]|nr:LytTR family transcriptional regulator DNA-binding domain-containing protein [Mucilaginibacter polytrichastri]